MDYLKGLSVKAIVYGVSLGYIAPLICLKILGPLMLSLGISQLFGAVPLLISVALAIVAPLACGYIAAKNSTRLPIINGLAATSIGVTIFAIFSSFNGIIVYSIVILLAAIFGYTGAHRYVAHG